MVARPRLQPSEKKIEESKLVLEGLVQHYKLVSESDKSRVLVELLDHLDFNQARPSRHCACVPPCVLCAVAHPAQWHVWDRGGCNAQCAARGASP